MHYKRNLTLVFSKYLLLFRNIGLTFWLPLIIVNLFLPVINYLYCHTYGLERLYTSILEYSMLFLPLFSVWWSIFIMRDFVESDGCELLYIHGGKNKLSECMLPFLLFALNVSLWFFFYAAIFSNMLLELIRLLIIMFFYASLTYFVMVLSRSLTASFLINIIYTLINIVTRSNNDMHFPLYYSLTAITPYLLLTKYLIFFILSVILIALGVAVSNFRLVSK